MGLQLGPGFLRRPPHGWVTAQVSAIAHRAWQPGTSGPDGGQSDIDTACMLNARWRVELPGREPYEFDEQRRTAPTWVLGGAGIGAGRRWYKVRLKPTHGLMDGIAFPCFVDPSDPERSGSTGTPPTRPTSIDGAATPASSASWPGARPAGGSGRSPWSRSRSTSMTAGRCGV